MIAVSYLKSKYSKINTLNMLNKSSYCDMIHVDLMDGIYVTNNNFTIIEVLNDLKDITKPLDIHLMVDKPLEYIKDLALLRPTRITIHLNISNNIYEVIEKIKEYNIQVGIAINPNEDINLIDKYLGVIDYVLIMSVIPGLGGQKFIPSVIDKIAYLQEKNILIGIDGGINDESIKYLKGYRIDNIVVGSFICMNDDFDKQIMLLKN